MYLKKTCFDLLLMVATVSIPLGTTVWATTCTKPNDWLPLICDADDWGAYNPAGSRCWDNTATRAQMQTGCTNEAVGCADLGGCFGPNAPGHWVVTVIDGKTRRCKCGCWAKETEFASLKSDASGSKIIAGGESQDDLFAITSFDVMNGLVAEELPINGVVYGLEKEQIYKFTTDTQHSFTITSAHPVPVVKNDGSVNMVKTADQLKVGDLLMGSDGVIQKLTSIERYAYTGQVVNFNIKTDDPLKHFVAANGIIMGDNAWQQALATRDARRLSRSDILRELLGKNM